MKNKGEGPRSTLLNPSSTFEFISKSQLGINAMINFQICNKKIVFVRLTETFNYFTKRKDLLSKLGMKYHFEIIIILTVTHWKLKERFCMKNLKY